MKNVELIKRLEGINKSCEDYGITVLIEELKQEVLVEDFKGFSTKQRLNKCLKYSEKLSKKLKPVLAYTDNEQISGYQVFTDSYFMVALNESDKLPIKDYKEVNEKWTYPNVKWFDYNRRYYENKTFKCNIGTLLKHCKVDKHLELVNEKTDFLACVDTKMLELFITFMNIKSNEEITFKTMDALKPILVEKDNGSFGILMPIRKIGNISFKELHESDL